jgi:heme-degrading monooxygenase HmoA
MIRMFARHQVTDYEAWRKVYDAFDRESLGVRRHSVYRGLDDPNEVTVTHDFDDRKAAEAFASSDELRSTMATAGVIGEPNIWITTQV